MKAFTTALAAMVASVEASKIYGSCQEPEVQQNFDLNRYLGLWYESRRDTDCAYESGICVTASYSMNADGTVRVRNNEWMEETNEWSGGTGQAFEVDPSKDEGYLKVKFGRFIPAGDYKILETDYDNYTVVYGCSGIPNTYNIEYAWILTRDANPSQAIVDKGLEVIRTKIPTYNMSALYATPTGDAALSNGGDCPYESEP